MRRHTEFALAAAILAAAPWLATAAERTGEQIVKQQCASCHERGVHGAPRIDDRAAWVPRMKQGLDATVASAIKGHGKMPARGGLADLTDSELRSAIVYLFNPAGVPPRPAPPPDPGPNHKVVDGTDIYLGVKPQAGDLHTVSITLRDNKTGSSIGDADVEVKVTNPVMGSETKRLKAVKTGDVVSYGNDFRITGKEPHVISVQIRRPQNARVIETKFDYKG